MEERGEESAGGHAPTDVRPEDYADIGVRVAGVLNAAEEAAEQIRADARRSAEDIRRQAEAEARRFTAERRREADQEAHRVLAAAHSQAKAIRDEAQAAARQVEEAGLLRQEQFRQQIRALEQRVERALDGLRGVTAQLQDVVLDAAPDTRRTAVDVETHAPVDAVESAPAKPRRRFGLGARRAAEPDAELAAGEPSDADVYESLRGAVEKRGGRWVPRETTAEAMEGIADGGDAASGALEDAPNRKALLERAKQLGIRDRTKMSDEDLAQAVAAAESDAAPPP
jgi:hypothetical protein